MASLSDICSELADIQPMLLSEHYAGKVKEKMVKTVALKIVGLKTMGASTAHTLMFQVHSMNIDDAFTSVAGGRHQQQADEA